MQRQREQPIVYSYNDRRRYHHRRYPGAKGTGGVHFCYSCSSAYGSPDPSYCCNWRSGLHLLRAVPVIFFCNLALRNRAYR